MATRRMLRSLVRTIILGGLSWAFAPATPPVEANCYTRCKITLDSNHQCVGVNCASDPGTGQTTCYISGCNCVFLGGSCTVP
jgi:hypothetical protein